MRRLSALGLAMIVPMALLGPAGGAMSAATTRAGDVRALWVPRSGLTTPASISVLVRSARDAGFTDLLVQVRGRGESFYASDIEPRASDLDGQPGDFDPLKTTLELAHAAGLQVHAWVNVNLVASAATLPRDRHHVARRHPEWLMVPKPLAGILGTRSPRSPAYLATLARWTQSENQQVEGLYLSPIPPESRAYTTSVVRELVERYPIDGLHLDYIRYPGDMFDYSTAALGAFRESRLAALAGAGRQQLDRAATVDPAAWATQQAAEWATFRRDRLTLLMAEVQAAARAARPGLLVSAAVIPSAADARDRKLQEWPVWARAGYLDAVCPMIYTTNIREFTNAVEALPAAAGDTPVWAGIGAYRLPLAQTIEHIRLARRHGAAGIAIFSYEKLADSGSTPGVLAGLSSALLELNPRVSRR